MALQMKYACCLFVLLILTEFSYAALVVQEAHFFRTFDGKDYYGTESGRDFGLQLSTMSNDGKVVAFYGYNYFDSANHIKLFIHNFESASEPVPVTLPASVRTFNSNAGLVSNADGSRIFFIASSTETSSNLFCMVNTLTGVVTILLEALPSDIENPYDIATDAAGDYLYFNEEDNGDRGDLWRIQTSGSAVPELVIDADTIGHPSGGVGRFIDQFDISDDGKTIAFFIEGRIPADGSAAIRTDKELFVKTVSGIRFLTNNDENSKTDLVISGDGSTIVYTTNNEWMVTTSAAIVESQIHIEPGYQSCGYRPGISRDGSMIFACSNPNGVSSAHGYLIRTDGTSRRMVEPGQISMRGTSEGLHLSDDGTRVFFRNRDFVYPDEWYNMTAGVFGANLWPAQVPKVTDVSYPPNMFSLLENNENFEIKIGVSDPQGDVTINNVMEYLLFPEGYDAYGYGPISIFMNTTPSATNLYTARGRRGSAWPDRVPILTARFSVEDVNGNVSYADTLVQPPAEAHSVIFLVLPAILNGANH